MAKTIKVEVVKDMINNMLENSIDSKTEGRSAIALVLERVLMETDNYKGFKFTDIDNDETRRMYF